LTEKIALTASALMKKDVVSISPESTLAEALDILEAAPFSGLPVVDDENHVVGVLSKTDVIAGVLGHTGRSPGEMVAGMIYHYLRSKVDPSKLGEVTVADVMTRRVHTVSPDTTVRRVARTMVRYEVNRIPVVDEDEKLLGIITRSDLLTVLSEL